MPGLPPLPRQARLCPRGSPACSPGQAAGPGALQPWCVGQAAGGAEALGSEVPAWGLQLRGPTHVVPGPSSRNSCPGPKPEGAEVTLRCADHDSRAVAAQGHVTEFCCLVSRVPPGPEEAEKLAAERARAPVVPFGADLCCWGQEAAAAGSILRRVQPRQGPAPAARPSGSRRQEACGPSLPAAPGGLFSQTVRCQVSGEQAGSSASPTPFWPSGCSRPSGPDCSLRRGRALWGAPGEPLPSCAGPGSRPGRGFGGGGSCACGAPSLLWDCPSRGPTTLHHPAPDSAKSAARLQVGLRAPFLEAL